MQNIRKLSRYQLLRFAFSSSSTNNTSINNSTGSSSSIKRGLKSPLLTRDFVYDRLYNSDSGYFCKDDLQIGEMKQPIPFKDLLGYQEYQKQLSDNYPKNAWLTPSEIFKPYYGMSIANYMQQTMDKLREQHEKKRKTSVLQPFDDKIRIIEVGAGQASAAQSILMYFKNYEQSYYANIEYTIVEISPQMCKKATEKLKRDHPKLFERGQVRVCNEDFMFYKPLQKDKHHFVLFLEVLDNMPHDRVYRNAKTMTWTHQAQVEFTDANANEGLNETKVPVSDPLVIEFLEHAKTLPNIDHIEEEKSTQKGGIIQQILRKFFENKQAEDSMFIPTFCLRVLKHVSTAIPEHNVIFADFDMLATDDSVKQGINAPVVSQKQEKSHEKKDFENYLVQRGQADIFFPTDFRLLSHMYSRVTKKKGKVLKTHEFVEKYSKEKWAETKSGYNPLKEDFLNTSFFFTDAERNSTN